MGVFSSFSGEEFETFINVASKLRSDYDFGHTLDAKILPHGDTSVEKPSIRLFKPFDEHFIDFQVFFQIFSIKLISFITVVLRNFTAVSSTGFSC